MNALSIAVLGLACWRISSLITYERGPFHIFQRVREIARIKHNDRTGRVEVIPETFAGELLTCVWCISPYIGFILSVLYYLGGSMIVWLCLPLALSGLAIVVDRFSR